MAKKVGDLLGWGLLGISVYIVLSIFGFSNIITKLIGIAGSLTVIIVEANFLWRTRKK